MASCRFHAHKPAKAYCPKCHTLLCDSCGKPGKTCALCNKGALIDASRAPQGEKKTRTCTVHPQVVAGLKVCQSCDRPFCSNCFRFGGLCLFCTEKEKKALESLPRPELPTDGAPPAKKRRRKQTADLNVKKKFQKVRRRAMIRWAIGLGLLAPVAGLLYFDASVIQQILHMAPKKSPLASLKSLREMSARSGSDESYDQLVHRLETGQTTSNDAAETEALMAKITGGQELSRPEQSLANRLEAFKSDPEAEAKLKAANERSRKVWGMLSQWSNEDKKEAIRQLAPPPALQTVRVVRHSAAARHETVPSPIRVGLQGLHSGQTLRGHTVVSANVGGGGGLDHVELLVNGQWQGLSNQPPYRFEWDTSGNSNGPCTVQLVAYDASGQKHASRPVRVTIAN